MPIKYDIIYPKKGQLTLLCNGGILANSAKKSYLINKMKTNQDEMIASNVEQKNVYEIVDFLQDNLVLETYTFESGEKGNGKRRESQGKNINFVEIDPVRPVFSTCYAIANNDGEIITNLDLMGLLYDCRYINSFPCEISNKTLAYLATYIPTSKEELLCCYGFGEKKYKKCGEKLLAFILNYLKENAN